MEIFTIPENGVLIQAVFHLLNAKKLGLRSRQLPGERLEFQTTAIVVVRFSTRINQNQNIEQ